MIHWIKLNRYSIALVLLILSLMILGILTGCNKKIAQTTGQAPDTTKQVENNNHISNTETTYSDEAWMWFEDVITDCDSVNKELSGKLANTEYKFILQSDSLKNLIVKYGINKPKTKEKEYIHDTVYKDRFIKTAGDCSIWQKQLESQQAQAKKELKISERKILFRNIGLIISWILLLYVVFLHFKEKIKNMFSS